MLREGHSLTRLTFSLLNDGFHKDLVHFTRRGVSIIHNHILLEQVSIQLVMRVELIREVQQDLLSTRISLSLGFSQRFLRLRQEAQ